MKLSLYTFVKDGLYYDFHVVDMLKHHLPLADEIIVNEGYSSDKTYEAIEGLDPKIKITRNHWDRSDPKTWSMKFKEQTRRRCTGDWCILLDIDEFIPEWEFEHIRGRLARTEATVHPMTYVHFYGNYKVYNAHPEAFGWPVRKHTIHRNLDTLEVWGDGSNVRLRDNHDVSDARVYGEPIVEVHHFGFVRDPARLRQKWRIQRKRNEKNRWDHSPGIVYDVMPHRWDDPDVLPHLAIYPGSFIRAVRENPREFVRDDFRLCDLLQRPAGPPNTR
jgi:hypothetical protein